MRLAIRSYALHMALAGWIVAAVTGCDDSGTAATAAAPATMPASQPAQPQVQSLDTAQLLEQAQRTSETADPYAVDGGALLLNDTSDSTDPVLVSAI